MAATSRFLLDPIGSGAMALRPPSYFAQENPSIKDPSEEREVLAELTALREENVKLKSVQTENTLTSCSDVSCSLVCRKELRVDRSTEEESVASNFVPLAEFVRMKTQLQECIELLRTENGMLSDRAINLEKTRLKVGNACPPSSCTRLSAHPSLVPQTCKVQTYATAYNPYAGVTCSACMSDVL